MFKKLFNNRITKKIKYIWQQLQNQRQNRQCIGQDRDGNKYYQYYSYWGLPTRRQIRWKQDGHWDLTDLVYYNWLHKNQLDPPTQQQKQQFYLQEKLRYQRAMQWDKKQQLNRLQFKRKRQQLLLRDKAMKQIHQQLQAKSQLTDIKTKRQSIQKSNLRN